MFDFVINSYARAQGVTNWLMDALPMLGAIGGILGVAGSILARASAAHDPAGVFHAIHPTAEEAAAFSLSLAAWRTHWNHQATLAKLDDHTTALAGVIPPINPQP